MPYMTFKTTVVSCHSFPVGFVELSFWWQEKGNYEIGYFEDLLFFQSNLPVRSF